MVAPFEEINLDPTLVDMSQWPILVSISAPDMNADILKRQFDIIGAIYDRRKEPYVLIIDARSGRKPNSAERRVMNDFRERYKGHLQQYCYGIAFVFKSALIKGVLTAMYWIMKPNTETRVFTQYEAAIAWAKEQLREGTTYNQGNECVLPEELQTGPVDSE